MKIQFKKDVDSPEVHIGEGNYRRSFNRRDQPFEVKPEEWAILQSTGFFEPAPEKQTQPEKKADQKADSEQK